MMMCLAAFCAVFFMGAFLDVAETIGMTWPLLLDKQMLLLAAYKYK